jgi:GT2 family glycosyltransferase
MTVAVVILNWNGKHWLAQFLPSVVAHSPEAMVYVADNNSTDDSIDFVLANFPSVKIIRNTENFGFAGGYNAALKEVEEDIYVLLNSDVEVSKNWITPILNQFKANSNLAAAQPKILAYHQKDSFEYAGASGGYIDKYGFPFCRGRVFNHLEKDKGQHQSIVPIFWATGASLFISKKAYWEAGALDEDFFAHMEEIDLCWRLHHLKYEIIVCPESVVYHVGGGTLDALNPRKTFLNFRNGLYLLYKNLPSNILFRRIASRMILDGLAGVQFLLKGQVKHTLAILKAHIGFYKALGSLKKKRVAIPYKMPFDTSALVFQKSLAIAAFLKGAKTTKNLKFNTNK